MRRPLSEQIKRHRTRCGLTQQALAEKAGLSRIYVAKLEAGDRLPSLPALARIAKELGVRVRIDLVK